MTAIHLFKMADAAYAPDIPPGFAAVAGYYGGPDAYHVWPASAWQLFPGWKVPIWVAGFDGNGEGANALATLRALGVPEGAITAVDMEDRLDDTYVENFGAEVRQAYRVWVYGSNDTVRRMPALNGYWVADYSINPMAVFLEGDSIRGVQYAPDLPPGYDASLVRSWTARYMWGASVKPAEPEQLEPQPSLAAMVNAGNSAPAVAPGYIA